MTPFQETSAVLFWTSETDPDAAAADSAERLSSLRIHQRVVRVVARRNGWADIQFGPEEFRVKEECLKFIEPLHLHIGDRVAFSSGHGIVRDILWHFKDGVPNYYLEHDGKKLSKRYLAGELTGV
jgi:hypothetical protein